MHFSGGSSCGGKTREAWVALVCGEGDELLAAREDEMCVYGLTLQTPSACSSERLAFVRQQLASVSKRHKQEL